MLTDYLKTAPQFIIPKQKLTVLAGLLANIRIPIIKNHLIRRFIRKYNINMQEAREERVDHYETFNDFFVRHLKPECRPIADNPIVSPVDGYISEFGRITEGKLLQAKGWEYTAVELLACDPHLSSVFQHGCFATLYLSPKDYHRVHMPLHATLQHLIHVPGKLFSVQPATVRVIPQLFARNERLVALFETEVGPNLK